MPAVKKITKKQHPKPSPKPARKPAPKPAKKPTKKHTKKAASKKGGGCGCTGSQKTMRGGSFVDMDALAKLSVPFGLLIAKAGLEDFLKSKKTVAVKVPVRKVSVTQKTVVRSPTKKVVINRRFL